MVMFDKVRVKHFQDGTTQYYFFTQTHINYDLKTKSNKKDFNTDIVKKSIIRSKEQVFDYAKNNKFDYFITLTFDKNLVERFDYNNCVLKLESFTKYLRRHNCQYILVPEQHKNGAWHFHGLIQGNIPLTDSGLTSNGNVIYNITGYNLGFSTATKILDNSRVSSYITKYLTKTLGVPLGSKRYWVSRGLKKPVVVYGVNQTHGGFRVEDYYYEIVLNAQYSKITNNKYGVFELYEIRR